MKVVEGNFSDNAEEPKATDALQAFLEMAQEGSNEAKVAVIYIDEYGISVGGNTLSTPDLMYMLSVGHQSVLESAMHGGQDETTH